MHWPAGVDNRVAYLKQHVAVEAGTNDAILTVQFTAGNAKDAVTLVGAVADAYAAYHTRQKQATASDFLATLQKQYDESELQLADEIEAELALLRAAKVTSFDNGPDAGLAQLREKTAEARLATADAKALYDRTYRAYATDSTRSRQLDDLERSESGLVASDVEFEQLRASIQDLEGQLERVQREYTAAHPMMRQLGEKLDRQRALYVVAAKKRWAAAQQREETLGAALADQEGGAADFAARAAEYRRRQAEAERLGQQLGMLAGRMAELRSDQHTAAVNIQPIEPAHAGTPAGQGAGDVDRACGGPFAWPGRHAAARVGQPAAAQRGTDQGGFGRARARRGAAHARQRQRRGAGANRAPAADVGRGGCVSEHRHGAAVPHDRQAGAHAAGQFARTGRGQEYNGREPGDRGGDGRPARAADRR